MLPLQADVPGSDLELPYDVPRHAAFFMSASPEEHRIEARIPAGSWPVHK